MARRCTWRETPKGHWLCQHGAYAAVLKVSFDAIQIRIKLPDDTVITFQADDGIPAFAEIEAEQRMVAEATARGELHLLGEGQARRWPARG